MTEKWVASGVGMLAEEFGGDRVNRAIAAVEQFTVEMPTWTLGAFGGGRFGGYIPPGAARTIEEKLDDAKYILELTGATPIVATHVLCDLSADGTEPDYQVAVRVRKEATARGLGLGAVNPTYFLSGSHRGSFSSMDQAVRESYIRQTLFAGQVARELAGGLITLWFPDGSAYPGQIQLRDAYQRLCDSLEKSCADLVSDVTVLIEYKVFEPGTYSTTVPDWGAALALARRLGGKAGVLVDMGHHHHTTNIEQIVAMLLAEGVPAGFHFNTRYAADDDHSVEPNQQMARIFYELARANVVVNPEAGKNWAYMIDQNNIRENRMQGVLHTIDSLQLSLAKAMLIDETKLVQLQQADEIIHANRLVNDALINADVRPIVARARLNKKLPVDPVAAYVASGYQARIEKSRS